MARKIEVTSGDELALVGEIPAVVRALLSAEVSAPAATRGDDGVGSERRCGSDPRRCAQRCEAGSAASCIRLGNLYLMGRRLPRDWTRAAGLYALACEAGSAAGCTNLATMSELGFGTAANMHAAEDLFERACRSGEQAGCAGVRRVRARRGG